MRWKVASKKALEMAAWTLAPVAALGAHQGVRMKLLFLQQYHLVIAQSNDRTVQSESLWKMLEQHYGWLCGVAFLVPVLCSFVQHLGLRGWWRALIGAAVSAPALWYTWVALQMFGKVTAPAS
jgi:hypothetical protein